MLRRLYFLFPYPEQAAKVVDELREMGLDAHRIHALARPDISLAGLPGATRRQRQDEGYALERIAWNGNLWLFGVALVGAVLAAAAGALLWAVICIAVMAASFTAGLLFCYVPDAHLNEVRGALHHGEVLLMVDVPRNRVKAVEDLVQHHHPEASVGGVGWAADAFGL